MSTGWAVSRSSNSLRMRRRACRYCSASRVSAMRAPCRAGAGWAYGSRPSRRRLPMLIPWLDRWTGPLRRPPWAAGSAEPTNGQAGQDRQALSWPTVHRPSTPERVTTPGVGLSRVVTRTRLPQGARSPGRWPDPGEAQGKHPTIDLRKSPYGPGGVTPPDDRDALLGLERAAPAPGGTPGATRTTRNGTQTQGRGSPAAGLPLPGMVDLGSAGDNPSLVGTVL